jgi:hypothetical protein
MIDPTTHILLHAQRANLQALLALLLTVPEAQRNSVRAGAVQALGALEDALGVERTMSRREERREERRRELLATDVHT